MQGVLAMGGSKKEREASKVIQQRALGQAIETILRLSLREDQESGTARKIGNTGSGAGDAGGNAASRANLRQGAGDMTTVRPSRPGTTATSPANPRAPGSFVSGV